MGIASGVSGASGDVAGRGTVEVTAGVTAGVGAGVTAVGEVAGGTVLSPPLLSVDAPATGNNYQNCIITIR